MKVAHLRLAVAVLCIFPGSAEAAASAQPWNTYTNVRYGYRICYPRHLFNALPEAVNGDGRVLRGINGAELRVFGSNALDRKLADEAKLQASGYLGTHGKVMYHRVTRAWDVTSGDDGRGVAFYNKRVQRDDQFVEFQLKYPVSSEARYKPVIERLSQCFKLFKPAF